ncbi:MAG: hypothetical protein ACO377_14145, partial [Pseudomonadales bacterium]
MRYACVMVDAPILAAQNALGRSGIIALLTLATLLGTRSSHAEEETPTARDELMEVSCRDEENRPNSWLDRTHSYLNQRLCEPAAWFDGFFGDDRALEETPVGTFFRLRNEVRWDQSEDLRARVRLSANISLPGASEKLRLLLTRDEDVHGEFDTRAPVEEGQQDTRLGLRYNLSDRKQTKLDLDATVRANFTTLNPVVRARYRHVEPLSLDTFMRFTQIAFWEAEDGYGTTSRADWEWFRSFDTQDRYTLEGTWSEATDG